MRKFGHMFWGYCDHVNYFIEDEHISTLENASFLHGGGHKGFSWTAHYPHASVSNFQFTWSQYPQNICPNLRMDADIIAIAIKPYSDRLYYALRYLEPSRLKQLASHVTSAQQMQRAHARASGLAGAERAIKPTIRRARAHRPATSQHGIAWGGGGAAAMKGGAPSFFARELLVR